jgi:beta-glucanase (GH16 family)
MFISGRKARGLAMAATVAAMVLAGASEPVQAQTWQPVWSDEFNRAGSADATKWSWETGGHGWGNNELQFYTNNRRENSRVELLPGSKNGRLIIEARKEAFSGSAYTSARLSSIGNWAYGRMEVRAKLPTGRGLWPAIWMLPKDWTYGNGSWPDNGEIDIMEQVGYDPNTIHATVHTKLFNHVLGTQVGKSTVVNTATSAFNDYVLEWRPNQVAVFVNGLRYFTFDRQGRDWQAFPFDKNFAFRLNMAVGGNWGGAQGVDNTIFPRRMEVDYVRVFKMNSTSYSSTPVALPGRIEAERFDNGGQGFAYHDSDAANNGGQYRTTSVDIDANADGYAGYHIGWMNTDEWLTYSVNLTKSTNYGFTFRVASPYAGKTFYIEVDDKRATPDIVVPNTGGWNNWQNVAWTKVYLTQGAHKIRLVSKSDSFNLNWFDVWDAGA